MEDKKHPGGRPTKYKKEYAEQARKICRLGATDPDLADIFEVTRSTINKWKLDHEEFSDALKEGKLTADEKVELSLFERATGYEHKEEKIFNNNGQALIVPTTKHYAPDTTAIIYYLNNRMPEKYRNKQEFTHKIDAAVIDELKDEYGFK